MTELETFLDVKQVAEMLGLSVDTIRKWVLIRYISETWEGGTVFRAGNPGMGENPYSETGGGTRDSRE
jgi:transposase